MTTYEKKRIAEIERHSANIGHDCGAKGRIFELECASAGSRKTRVSKQGQADIYVHFENGNYSAECKINGGRIESLKKAKAPKFVIYRLDFIQKHKASKNRPAWNEVRHVNPVLIPTEIFLNALVRFNAIKSTNGNNPELAIQVSSKKFYEWLLDWPIPYEPGLHYTADDFEGLE